MEVNFDVGSFNDFIANLAILSICFELKTSEHMGFLGFVIKTKTKYSSVPCQIAA